MGDEGGVLVYWGYSVRRASLCVCEGVRCEVGGVEERRGGELGWR